LSYLVLSIAWMIVIFAFSHQAYSGAITEEYLHDANIPIRKLAHMAEFGILYFLYLRTIGESRLSGKISLRGASLLAFVLTVAYASLDEWHQSFVPGRSSCLRDVMVDSFGALIALVGCRFVPQPRAKSRKHS
jgi:VanZ family protein